MCGLPQRPLDDGSGQGGGAETDMGSNRSSGKSGEVHWEGLCSNPDSLPCPSPLPKPTSPKTQSNRAIKVAGYDGRMQISGPAREDLHW